MDIQTKKINNTTWLMELNYDSAYLAFSSILAAPYVNGYFNQTFGYRINHKNRNDSATNLNPFVAYNKILNRIDVQTRGIIAEYRAENTVETYYQNGCAETTSQMSLFGYDGSSNLNKLLGYASYSDEVFTLKDIHKQIDKF